MLRDPKNGPETTIFPVSKCIADCKKEFEEAQRLKRRNTHSETLRVARERGTSTTGEPMFRCLLFVWNIFHLYIKVLPQWLRYLIAFILFFHPNLTLPAIEKFVGTLCYFKLDRWLFEADFLGVIPNISLRGDQLECVARGGEKLVHHYLDGKVEDIVITVLLRMLQAAVAIMSLIRETADLTDDLIEQNAELFAHEMTMLLGLGN